MLSGIATGLSWLCHYATGLSWLCHYRVLPLGPVNKVAPVDKLSETFVIVLALVFPGEKPS